jgi:two-component system chemotaxis response regulator CheB
VVVSAVTTEGSRRALEALDAGALEVVGKPSATSVTALRDMIADLAEKVVSAARADMSKLKIRPRSPRPEKKVSAPKTVTSPGRRLIAIGASTGGTVALHKIIEALPDNLPPVVIVQHMPPVFTRMFADSLDRTSAPHVVEAEDGMVLSSGLVAVAPGDRHLTIRFSNGAYVARLSDEPKVSGHRPSVDVLFHSAAQEAGSDGLGVLLTGMGRDGADGLLDLHRRGGRCIAQDEASSVVWGMPREAWLLGAAERLVPLDQIAQEIVRLAGKE